MPQAGLTNTLEIFSKDVASPKTNVRWIKSNLKLQFILLFFLMFSKSDVTLLMQNLKGSVSLWPS